MRTNQFAVYQVKDGAVYRPYRFCPYDKLTAQHLKVDAANYDQLYISPLAPKDTAAGIHARFQKQVPKNFKGHAISVSDVYVLNQDGVVTAYYVDKDKLVVLPGFLHLDSSGTEITIETTGYQIEGKSGTWAACDETVVDGFAFYLMQNEQYKDNAAYVILASDGRIAADPCKNFDADAIEQIRNFLHPSEKVQPVADKPPPENWQKEMENGEYLHSVANSAELTEESIQEQIQHLPKPRVIGKRVSALDRLHIKQAEIAIRSGKPIPKSVEKMSAEHDHK